MNPHNQLQMRLQNRGKGELGYSKCPCCRRVMHSPTTFQGNRSPATRTKGHLRNSEYTGYRFWIWQCNRCNLDQGGLSIWEWSLILERRQDERAGNVAELVARLESEFGIKEDVHFQVGVSEDQLNWNEFQSAEEAGKE